MLTVKCKNCEVDIKIFPSRAWRTNYCSNECKLDAKTKLLQSRERRCLNCNNVFLPRKYQIDSGNAKYCSAKCRNIAAKSALCSKESRAKALQTYKKNMELGLITHKSGPEHSRWKGGQVECVKRKLKDGSLRESVKKYRKKNPYKFKEWAHTRAKRKMGRLPRGTIKTKQEQQNYKCAYCGIDTTVKFHVDHIIPLAMGGNHIPENIQITCPSCNVRKWTKLDFSVEKLFDKEKLSVVDK